jgi:hypothetical protein
MLDEVSRMGDHAWDKDLAVRELDILPDLPLVLMARVGGFHTVGVSMHSQHNVHNVPQWHIGDMGPMPASPTQVIPYAV